LFQNNFERKKDVNPCERSILTFEMVENKIKAY